MIAPSPPLLTVDLLNSIAGKEKSNAAQEVKVQTTSVEGEELQKDPSQHGNFRLIV